jgi:hypothetical protein
LAHTGDVLPDPLRASCAKHALVKPDDLDGAPAPRFTVGRFLDHGRLA